MQILNDAITQKALEAFKREDEMRLRDIFAAEGKVGATQDRLIAEIREKREREAEDADRKTFERRRKTNA